MLSCFNCVWLFATLWTVAHQASLSTGILQVEYWSGLPCPPSEGLPDPGIEPASPTSPALTGRFFTASATWEAQNLLEIICKTHFCSEIFGSYEKSKIKNENKLWKY